MKLPRTGLIVAGIALVLCLVACASRPSAPTLDIEATVEARLGQQRAIEATVEPQPTATPYPTYTPVAVPTATTIPTATPRPTATPTPRPTSTPTSVPTPVPPTPTPTPILEPTYVLQWGTYDYWNDGGFDQPNGVAVDGSGNVYVSDRNNYRVQKFSVGQ